MKDESLPTCDGCDKKGYYGVCDDCRTPDYEVEAVNENARRPSHNDENIEEW